MIVRLSQTISFLLLILLLFLFFSPRINLITTDIGRHIKNGQVALEEKKIISTNYYSYTQTERPVINHHWGAGVIFYLIWKNFDFEGLSIFYAGVCLSAFLLFFLTARRLSNTTIALLIAILSLPLLVFRSEIRPEGFSFLFLGLFMYLYTLWRAHKMPIKALWILPVIQIIWVNVHIFFILGPILTGLFVLDRYLNSKRREDTFELGLIFLATSVACLLNPAGINGALIPFTIMSNYGYMIAENQSVIFMQRRFPGNPLYLHFEVVFGLLAIGVLLLVYRRREWKSLLWVVILFVLFSYLAWTAIRGLALFGYFLIPFGAFILHEFLKEFKPNVIRIFHSIALVVILVLIVNGLTAKKHYYSPYQALQMPAYFKDIDREKFWIIHVIKNFSQLNGLIPFTHGSALFFKEQKLKGPIFNNYDIGGFLILHLFPQEKVFVDNRPEAYSVAFFENVYVPMQESEETWQEQLIAHDINVIYFYRHDMTPWAQPFLLKRLKDPLWAPVYVDAYTIILLKRNEQNNPTIKRFELPSYIFRSNQS